MAFEDSKTYQNLQNAYMEKLISSAAYEIYGSIARRNGYVDIGNVFDRISRNELEHAVVWLREINEDILPSTLENLENAVEQEHLFGLTSYQEYARIANEEGFTDIASLFIGIANIDLSHELEFQKLVRNVEREEVFCKPENALWECMVCGNIMGGNCAPEICPICGFPQGYYKIYNEFC